MERFDPVMGVTTDRVRSDFLGPGPHQESVRSLVASYDLDQKLYMWQLFNVLGKHRIMAIVTSFYERVFADVDAPWFRDVFVHLGSMKYHVLAQSSMWTDVMGGGRRYVGGEKRLRQHHDKASIILTADGARRWMYHMNQTLQDPSIDVAGDHRVIPCLEEFIHHYMVQYADEFRFSYEHAPIVSSSL